MDLKSTRLTRLAKGTAIALIALGALIAMSGSEVQAKEVVSYFGTESGSGSLGGEFNFGSAAPSGDIAVNYSGAGPANRGDVYVLESGLSTGASVGNRLQRFALNDNGTPEDPYDDSYDFVSAWGADVIRPGGMGDLGNEADAAYEVCAIAAECKDGLLSAGNGTAGGNGSLASPRSVDVDQDTGDVYVTDDARRVNVYAGDGTFLRSFGWDVIPHGTTGNQPNNEQQTVTLGPETFGGSFTLTVNETGVATGITSGESSTVTGIKVLSGSVHPEDAVIFANTGATRTVTAVDIAAGRLTLSSPPGGNANVTTEFVARESTGSIPASASAATVESKIADLPAVAPGEISVSGPAGGPWTFMFEGPEYSDRDLAQMNADGSNLLDASGNPNAAVTTTDQGASYEVCVSAEGHICQKGTGGSFVGQIGTRSRTLNFASGRGIAVSRPDGNPEVGTIFLQDPYNARIGTFNLDGSVPDVFGSSEDLSTGFGGGIAVDSRGIVYVADSQRGLIRRYDSENANGTGERFLEPIGDDVAIQKTFGEPYVIAFTAYGDVSELEVSDGTTPLSGGAGASVTTAKEGGAESYEVQELTVDATEGQFRLTFNGQTTADIPYNANPEELKQALLALPSLEASPLLAGAVNTSLSGIEVDPDSDGAGPDTDALFVANTLKPGRPGPNGIQQFGPSNLPGMTTAPTAADAIHGSVVDLSAFIDLGLDPGTGRLFVSSKGTILGGTDGGNHGVYVLDEAGPLPSVDIEAASEVTATSATVSGTVNPNGPPDASVSVEYSTDGSTWKSGPKSLVGSQTTPQVVGPTLEPHPFGLEPNTLYYVRLAAAKPFAPPVVSASQTFTTLTEGPHVETAGSPLRTSTTVQFSGRVNPRNAATEYRFEYGSQGPCASNPCVESAPLSAGEGGKIRLVSQWIGGLEPGTTYHYRVIADNGNADGPSLGGDMTVTTRSSDKLLSHGEFPGPAESDRAWEQVSLADTGGNPVAGAHAISSDGSRAIYQVFGGTPLSDTGTVFNQLFAERTPSGWRSEAIYPPRDELIATSWLPPAGPGDLSSQVVVNIDNTTLATTIWRVGPGRAASKVYQPESGDYVGPIMVSADGTRVLAVLNGPLDPAFSVGGLHLYDISSGEPKLVGLMPDDTPAACGVGGSGAYDLPIDYVDRATHWVSADGRFAFFPSQGDECSGSSQLYARDFLSGKTELLSGPPVSGPACSAALIRSTSDEVFFWTKTRLDPEDTVSDDGCANSSVDGDVYRYDLGEGSLDCVTCVVAGLDASVIVTPGNHDSAPDNVGIAPNGSRVYFRSPEALVPGAASGGAYRVEVQSAELAYVGDVGGASIGSRAAVGGAITSDGSMIAFRSASAALNPVGGVDNSGSLQYYIYNDTARSLTCVSCPADGSLPRAPVDPDERLAPPNASEPGANKTLLAESGSLVFTTTTPLTTADQNTARAGKDPLAGTDVYEWRDGRQLLVTDGLTNWPLGAEPEISGISPSGRDAFFTAAARYTPDAPDGIRRLYDARIGGGFVFPEEPEPCPLEACQGTPEGAPSDVAPATGTFVGPGNLSPAPRGPRSCRGFARQAKRLSVRAKRARRAIRRASGGRRMVKMRTRARRLAGAAKRRSRIAKRCRARMSGTTRRAAR